jgi:hypothetical protein
MIQELIQTLVETPTEENKQNYLQFVTEMEYSLLQDAETLPFKSQEYFDKRKEAFAYRRNCAMMLLNSWVATHGSTENAPISYADTLNIPFQQIKKPQ